MSVTFDTDNLDASVYGDDYPTPSASSQGMEQTPEPSSEPPKKKRKAWGQPVPEIVKVLPPRKRAKTEEEKEQRRNERILRNRRAADKSRQRQKAAVAELEVKTGRMEKENASLRNLLLRYQQRFGIPEDLKPTTDFDDDDLTPLDLNDDTNMSYQGSPYQTPVTVSSPHPTLVQTEPTPTIQNTYSPVLTPSLVQSQDVKQLETATEALPNLSSTTDMAHYPAEVMCGPQCLSEVGSPRLQRMLSQALSHNGLSHLLQTLHYLMIFQQFSTTMLTTTHQMWQILAQKLVGSSVETVFQSLIVSFPLIHSLISMPSTSTRPAVFRLKLLSRLLACSPLMARLLMAATSAALQRVVEQGNFAENPDSRWAWSSLMTIKWGIIRLEREHRKIRRHVVTAEKGDMCESTFLHGVDLRAVERSRGLWDRSRQTGCTSMNEQRPTVQEVH